MNLKCVLYREVFFYCVFYPKCPHCMFYGESLLFITPFSITLYTCSYALLIIELYGGKELSDGG